MWTLALIFSPTSESIEPETMSSQSARTCDSWKGATAPTLAAGRHGGLFSG